MPRHKADMFAGTGQIEALEIHESAQADYITKLENDLADLKHLLAWVGDHIHVRNARLQRTTAKCALCPFTYKKDSRGRSIKEQCRHNEIWQLSK